MNFVDFALVRLAQKETRASIFDQDALEQIVAAGYAEEVSGLAGPYSGSFDEFQIGVPIPRRATVDGHWGPITGVERTDVQLALSGVGRASTVRADALWRGSVVARTSPANSRIRQVVSAWPDTDDIDRAIVAALGSLPADPAALERERRTRFLAIIRASAGEPAALTDVWLDDWLRRIGAGSIGDLMMRYRGQLLTGALRIAFCRSDRYSGLAEVSATERRDSHPRRAALDRGPPRREQDDPRAPARVRRRAGARSDTQPACASRGRVDRSERGVR